MVKPKSFPALERAIEFYERFSADNEPVRKQVRASLEKAEELLAAAEKWEEYENKKTTYPRLRAAIAACQPGKGS